jgi:hypothetical protein
VCVRYNNRRIFLLFLDGARALSPICVGNNATLEAVRSYHDGVSKTAVQSGTARELRVEGYDANPTHMYLQVGCEKIFESPAVLNVARDFIVSFFLPSSTYAHRDL